MIAHPQIDTKRELQHKELRKCLHRTTTLQLSSNIVFTHFVLLFATQAPLRRGGPLSSHFNWRLKNSARGKKNSPQTRNLMLNLSQLFFYHEYNPCPRGYVVSGLLPHVGSYIRCSRKRHGSFS